MAKNYTEIKPSQKEIDDSFNARMRKAGMR